MLVLPSGETRRLYVADAFLPRLGGLAWIHRPSAGEGLLIPRCRSIHTIGMRFPIDVAFTSWPVDEGGHLRVLAVHERVLPLRLARLPLRALSAGGRSAAVELPAGDAQRLGLAPGVSLVLFS